MRPRILSLFGLVLTATVSAQCPQLYDYYGAPSDAPAWYSCSGTAYTLLVASPQSVGPFSIDWGDGSTPYTGISLAPPQSVSHTYPAGVAEYTVVFTTITGCSITGRLVMEKSTSASIQIPVGGLTQVCAPQSVDFINSSTNVSPNTTFVWDFGDASTRLTFDHTNLGQTISHTYMPGTVGCETTVRLTAQNTCNTLQGGPSVATFNPIRIWDIDSANISPSATLLCWPDNRVTFLNTTDRNCLQQGNIYQRYEYWNFGDYWGMGHDSIIDWNPWPPTFPRTISYPAIGSYEVMMLDSNYCGIDTAYVTINIVPPPSVALAVTPATICAGETAHFHETTTGGANYFTWDFGEGGGFQWTGAGDQTHTYNSPGVYTVRYTASIQGATAGCSDTATVQVTVLPSPTAGFTLDQDAACTSLTTDPTNTSVNGVSWQWDFGDGTTDTQFDPPPHTYPTVGDYTIRLRVSNSDGCQDATTRTVHVYDVPNVQIGAQNVCVGSPASFRDLTSTPPGNRVMHWQWDFGDGATDTVQAPSHLYASAGIYTVTLTVTTPYCSGTGTRTVTVEAKPLASFTAAPVTGCSPLTVGFTNNSTGAVSYLWLFGDGSSSTETSPTHTYANFGTADSVRTVLLIASTAFGCSDTARTTVTVSPGVLAAFTHDAIPGCAPLTVHFNNQSSGAGQFHWDFGDGTTSTDASPEHVYVNNTFVLQTVTITLTATAPAGCVHSTQRTILVYPAPNFSFVAQPDSGCTPLVVTFPSVVGAVSYQWDFGDGSTGSGPTPAHTYINATASMLDLPVRLIASNAFGCMDTAYAHVRVFPAPAAGITLDAVNGCHPLTATLTNTSHGAVGYHWNYGDGSGSDTALTTHAHTWYNFMGPGAQTFPIALTAITDHGCTNTATAQVEVYPRVDAAFVADSVGCSPFDPHFVNVSTGASSYAWDFGDGSGTTIAGASHTYVDHGLNDVVRYPSLIATSSFGCTDTASARVLIHPAPIAQFTAAPAAGCTPLPVALNDRTIGANTVHWSFGDGSDLNALPGDAMHTYTNPGTTPAVFNTRLIATTVHGCTDTATVPVQVYPPVVAAFNAPVEGCSPLAVSLSAQGAGAAQWLWTMGDGITLVGPDITHTYVNQGNTDAQYTITQVATSAFGCTDTIMHTVVVHPSPRGAFIATPFTQRYPDATIIPLNNTPHGQWSYAWDFGDGATSTNVDPAPHTYASWGTYTVTLVVSIGGCADTVRQNVTIEPPLPTASFIGSGEGCVPYTLALTNTSLQAIGYQWDFGDGGTSTADNPVYTWTRPGVYTVTLTAQGVGGGQATAVKVDSVIVHPRANAYFVLQPNEVVVPTGPLFTYNLSDNADQYVWDFGDGGTSTETAPVHYYTAPGTYDVWLVANNQWNCPDTFAVPAAVTAIAAGELHFPNAFTPGNSGPTDGVYDPTSFDNDFFFPVYKGVQDYHLQVFDRWGELIYESFDVRKGWDGYYRGRPAKQDVYAWKAYARFSSGQETTLTGDVTLLR
ncbi:MAG: PKD domain-containing protein [Flavobacteriales bacterium]